MSYKIEAEDLNAWFGNHQVLKSINMKVRDKAVTAIIGPSGCGKTTLIRCLDRMHELVPGSRVTGRALLDGEDVSHRAHHYQYAASVCSTTNRHSPP